MTRPGGSWGLEAEAEEEGSVGEVSEGQRPRLTLARERVMTGHSLLGPRTRTTGSRIDHPLRTTDPSSGAEARTTGSTETQQRRGLSPGQLSQSADLTELSLGDTRQGPVTIADLGVEPVMPTRTSHFHTDSSHSPPPQIQDITPLGAQAADWFSVSTDRPAPILVRQRSQETHSGEEAQGGSRVMAVHLPSAGLEEEEEEVEEEASISLGAAGGADSNSSGNDVF
ncbi:TALPID3 protein-like [Osmerus mordax]|uniref:TALPID3 protein-like n=1 Tax=Osmerus mordax TaxID=8014 RepID=UPI0035103786